MTDEKAIERMEEILRTGKWPSGLPVTIAERRVIAHNIKLAKETP